MAPRGRSPAAARAKPGEEEDGDDVIVLSSTPAKSEGEKKKSNSNKEINGSHNRNNHNNKNGNGCGSSSPPPDSTCVFPMARVRRLIGGEGGTADDGTRCTHEAVFLINKATEMFLQTFCEDAYAKAKRGEREWERKKRLAITYDHLSSIVCNETRYEFLSDFVPEKIRAEDALKEREAVEP